jgi:DNA-directed RNA polymerase subunit beta'
VFEVAGHLKFVDLVDGVTMTRQVDDVTGLSSVVVTSSRQRASGAKKELRPMVKMVDENGEDLYLPGSQQVQVHYFLPEGTIVSKGDGDAVAVGDVIARIPQETSKTRDITGGLPRVADLFEARTPKESAILAEITGVIRFGKGTKEKDRLMIVNTETDETYEELIPKWRHVNVFEGEEVAQGEVIADGALNPHDLLRLLGVDTLANYIVDEVQDVYRLQGVTINDKHIEVIVKQMLRKVEIKDVGDASFIEGEQAEYVRVREANDYPPF